MQVDLCRHIKTNGLQCRAVALSASVFCYFHSRLHSSHNPYRDEVYLHPTRIANGICIQLPPLEDNDAIQIAISSVVNALATGIITEKRAYALYQGLYLASANARRRRPLRHPPHVVRDICKEPWVTIPEARPDIAPPGRTIDIDESIDQSTESGCPVLTPLGRDAAILNLCAAASTDHLPLTTDHSP